MELIEFMVQQISSELNIKKEQVHRVIELLDDGNTIPFIARYRKEMTGQLDETKIRDISEKITYLRTLHQRKTEVIRLIEEQGKLTNEILDKIEKTTKLQQVEDIYRPFRPKRKTRAGIAKEKGLEPFALWMMGNREMEELKEKAKEYISIEKELTTIEEIIQGAQDIIAEMISDEPTIREWVRNKTIHRGILTVQAKDKEKESVYEMYYDYQETIRNIRHHRILAINRGEKEEWLKVKIELDEQEIMEGIIKRFQPFSSMKKLPVHLLQVTEDSYKRLIAPSIEREVRQILTERAEGQAIHIFSMNLRQLLLQPPIKNKMVLGIDPAYRTGCKLAVVNPIGKVEAISVIYPTPPQSKVKEAKQKMNELVETYGVEIIVIGNGTASRETEQFVADFIRESKKELYYIIVSEAGASVYSASKLAREEFPNLDVAQRSAISIARRLQDPLAELVKIDPKSVGVGQYQHDVTQKKLEASLEQVVESVVNYVGVDANTASFSLLSYISGLNKSVAKNIVKYREEHGKFHNREDLKQVPRFGAKTYEQAIGFLRIDGENPLDKTSIHPESYPVTYALLEELGFGRDDLGSDDLKEKLRDLDLDLLSSKLSVGLPTLKDIVESLIRPVRDPRDDLPKPIFHQDVLKIEDLKPGMHLQGTVRNIVDFGAFVDIGVKEDGLVHISEISDQYIKHPLDVLSVGDVIDVWVLDTDIQKKRISLTMKSDKVIVNKTNPISNEEKAT